MRFISSFICMGLLARSALALHKHVRSDDELTPVQQLQDQLDVKIKAAQEADKAIKSLIIEIAVLGGTANGTAMNISASGTPTASMGTANPTASSSASLEPDGELTPVQQLQDQLEVKILTAQQLETDIQSLTIQIAITGGISNGTANSTASAGSTSELTPVQQLEDQLEAKNLTVQQLDKEIQSLTAQIAITGGIANGTTNGSASVEPDGELTPVQQLQDQLEVKVEAVQQLEKEIKSLILQIAITGGIANGTANGTVYHQPSSTGTASVGSLHVAIEPVSEDESAGAAGNEAYSTNSQETSSNDNEDISSSSSSNSGGSSSSESENPTPVNPVSPSPSSGYLSWTAGSGSSAPFSNNTAYAFNAKASTNVAVYLGQTAHTNATSLEAQCQDPAIDIVNLAFLTGFTGPGGFPTVNFGALCGGQNDAQVQAGAAGLLDCVVLAANITNCHNMGKKVFLSLGGAVANSTFENATQAEAFADQLWNLFGGGTDLASLRPFGTEKVDGFDIDNESKNPAFYVNFVSKLRSYFPADQSQSYYISASPQCPLPDASIPMDVLQYCDFVGVQFYDNPECNLGTPGFLPSFQSWSSNLSIPNSAANMSGNMPAPPMLMLGAFAFDPTIQTPPQAGTGYVGADDLTAAISSIQQLNLVNFGGVTFWDGSEGHRNVVNNSTGETIISSAKDALLAPSQQGQGQAVRRNLRKASQRRAWHAALPR